MNAETALVEALRAAAGHWYGVPGYPVTGIAAGLGARLPANEKVGLENCLGHSLSGRRSGLVVKHVGLNACADPLVQATTRGISAGVVVVVGDDVTARWSENTQDSRYYGELAEVPVLEPDGRAVADAVEEAFRISEAASRVALLRVTPALLESDAAPVPLPAEPHPSTCPVTDLTMKGRAARASRGTRDLFRWAAASRLNRPGRGAIGVGAADGDARVITVYPPPPGIGTAAEVREFGRPFVREHRGLRPPADPGEPETYARRGRRSVLCADCPFAPVIALLRDRNLIPVCDTGCALMATAPPFSHGVAGYGLGSSIGVAATSTGVALIGDYALLHSGINALIDAHAHGTPLLCIVLENRCLAMTGRQPHHGVEPYLAWAAPIVLDATDHAGLARAIAPFDRTTTVIVRGDCPEGARYGTMEC
ncbi:MAG: thiamine pyrophosphate-dependent enzyme [Methanospirillum sp.]